MFLLVFILILVITLLVFILILIISLVFTLILIITLLLLLLRIILFLFIITINRIIVSKGSGLGLEIGVDFLIVDVLAGNASPRETIEEERIPPLVISSELPAKVLVTL